MKLRTSLILFALVTLAGCSVDPVPTVEAAIGRTDGVLAYDTEEKVDIAELLPFMRRATWTDEWRLWKSSREVILADGRRLRFEELSPMFRIDGIEGTFLVTEEDSEEYQRLRNRIVIGAL